MKVSIIGAGRVGTSIAFSLLHREIVNEMVIIDKDRNRAEGEVLDLYHSTPMFNRCDIYSGDFENISNSDFVIITAGASQKPGETRLDLTKRNVAIMKEIATGIREYSKNSIVINVTNPVDVLTYVLWKELNLPEKRVIGTGTILDTARFRSLVSKQCGVSPASVHAYIIGEHGDSEIMIWSSASIGGVNIRRFCNLCNSENCTPL
ncbi:MAG: L-lactate dehydrogenase, partial [Thermotogaceae bacterium]|nr:L-lactate dehydrogenase [Thermotogaceae bacterium]